MANQKRPNDYEWRPQPYMGFPYSQNKIEETKENSLVKQPLFWILVIAIVIISIMSYFATK